MFPRLLQQPPGQWLSLPTRGCNQPVEVDPVRHTVAERQPLPYGNTSLILSQDNQSGALHNSTKSVTIWQRLLNGNALCEQQPISTPCSMHWVTQRAVAS